MDSPEGSANNAINAEIDRRVNEAVNASIRPLQDQMMQLLIALNGHLSLDRATPTPLASSKENESFAIFLPKFEKELAEGGGGHWADAVRINYLKGALNSTLWDRLINADGDTLIAGVSWTKEPRRAAKSQCYRSNSSSSEDNIKPQKDNYKCYNCNKISYIAIWCPKLRRLGPKKVKKVEKAKRREESSDSNAIEELGSSEAEESLGKE
ncbi:hypothetical protein K456DRAFT_58651 [Colletotrichum gloeosporioides 23]|nr:hypothetical protein K456DRAFT_58651 [Colletotrichum gloeosporioides 23]